MDRCKAHDPSAHRALADSLSTRCVADGGHAGDHIDPFGETFITNQSDGHKAEMIGACRSTTPHDGHDWQYSDTGYAECPGVPNQSDGAS